VKAKKKVITEIKKKYISGDPSITLLSPRQIFVTISGAVRYPGKYLLYATDRVDNGIALAIKTERYFSGWDIVIGKEIRKDETTQFDGAESNETEYSVDASFRGTLQG